jgi:hypothetical protein
MSIILKIMTVLSFTLTSSGCDKSDKEAKAYLYNSGEKSRLEISSDRILNIAERILSGAAPKPRALTTMSNIDKAKAGLSIEILFSKRTFTTSRGELLADRLLVEFNEGSPGNSDDKSYITIYWGNKQYQSPPYHDTGCDDLVKELKRIVDTSLNKNM